MSCASPFRVSVMADEILDDTPQGVSRRRFIKTVIAGGAGVASANYLFRSSALLGQSSAAGAVERLITITVNGRQRRVDVMKQETLAWTLRYKLTDLFLIGEIFRSQRAPSRPVVTA